MLLCVIILVIILAAYYWNKQFVAIPVVQPTLSPVVTPTLQNTTEHMCGGADTNCQCSGNES